MITHNELTPETLHAIEEAAKRAAKSAVKEILLTMGQDAENPSAILESQKDAAFLRRVRRATESRAARYSLAAFSALLSFVGALITLAVAYVVNRP